MIITQNELILLQRIASRMGVEYGEISIRLIVKDREVVEIHTNADHKINTKQILQIMASADSSN